MRARGWSRRFAVLSLAVGATGATTARRAHADEPPPSSQGGPAPPPTTERPGTPPPAPLKYTPYVDRSANLPGPFYYVTLGPAVTTRLHKPALVEISPGGGVGLTKSIWIDGSLGTLRVMPETVFHSVQIGPNALLLDTPTLELDATAHISFASDDHRPIEQIEPGVFGVVHLAHKLRIDVGLYIDANPGLPERTGGVEVAKPQSRARTDDHPKPDEEAPAEPTVAPPPTRTAFGLRLPINPGFQITQKIYAIINTGVTIDDFADARRTTAIPMGLTLGWSDRLYPSPKSPTIGLSPSISFPELFRPGAENGFRPGHATIGITFFYVSRY